MTNTQSVLLIHTGVLGPSLSFLCSSVPPHVRGALRMQATQDLSQLQGGGGRGEAASLVWRLCIIGLRAKEDGGQV